MRFKKESISMQTFFDRIKSKSSALQQRKMDFIGKMLLAQVHERFDTSGASSGRAWPPKVIDNGFKPLHSATMNYRNSFTVRTASNSVAVQSDVPYARVHEFGTIGKGGMLPSIVPKPGNKRGLFIPLSAAARNKRPSLSPRGARKTGSSKLVFGEDFVYAKQVDIPPRPVFPSSPSEQERMTRFIAFINDPLNVDVLLGQAPVEDFLR